MTTWENPSTEIETPTEVIQWCRDNITPVTDGTPVECKMRNDDITKVELLSFPTLTLTNPEKAQVTAQFPELAAKDSEP